MSQIFTAGQLVRISSDVITDTAENEDLLGELGLPGLFRHCIFEVIRSENDATRGAIVVARISNPEIFKSVIPGVKEVKYEGELVLLCKDIVPANMKITLDYVIESTKSKDQVVRELFATRKSLEASGLDKRHKAMRDNWKQIQIVRGELSGPMPDLMGSTSVYLPKHKLRFPLTASEIPSNDEESIKKFKQILSNKLRGVRSQRKVNTIETKSVFGINVQKQGGVYLQKDSLLKAYEEMMKTTLETDKRPTDPKATYLGIEIEFIYSGNYDLLKKLIIDKKLHRHICLVSDGSLRACHNNNGYDSREMKVLCKTTEVADVMKRLDSVFLHPEIDGYANRTCGLHVHLDARNRDVSLMYKNFVRVQSILRGSQPVGRIKNKHCLVNDTESIEELEATGARYWVVNATSFKKHKSIEIRIHEGTTNCEDIYNWVSFLDAIASHTKLIPKNELKFAEDVASKYDIDIPLAAIDYVDRRIERFKSLSIA